MPNKIVVPSDLSENSKNGIRFAIQLATQNNASLIFYNCIELIKPVKWKEGQFKTYVKDQLDGRKIELLAFVEQCYNESKAVKQNFECVVERGTDPKKSVIKYAVAIKASAICMATRGAGDVMKVIGTNASGIISSSPIPVFVIPNGYRKKKISKILYATDLEHVKSELKRVVKFASTIDGNLYAYHYSDTLEEPATRKKLLTVQQQHSSSTVSFIFDTAGDLSFAEKFEADLAEAKASLGILFTNQRRNWFEKLFQGSNSEELSFSSSTPILIFSKD
jgi:nucleotide-binding universal stress UspA family protein